MRDNNKLEYSSHLSLRIPREESQHGEFGTDGLSTAGRCSNKDIVIGGVKCVEDLCLYGVEKLELVLVQRLKVGVAQTIHRHRFQVQKFRGERSSREEPGGGMTRPAASDPIHLSDTTLRTRHPNYSFYGRPHNFTLKSHAFNRLYQRDESMLSSKFLDRVRITRC